MSEPDEGQGSKRSGSCLRGCLIALLLFIGFAYLGCAVYEHRHWMSFVPTGMPVERIVYTRTEAWGIGLPGDNETGVIVYALSPETAAAVARRGPAYLGRFGHAPQPHMRGMYQDWRATPALRGVDEHWARVEPGDARIGRPVRLADYLDTYGFGVAIDRDYAARIDRALASPGNYYAFGRTGVFLVIPGERLAVFAYAG